MALSETTAEQTRYKPASWSTRLRAHPAGPIAVVCGVLLLGLVVAGLLAPDNFFFLTSANLSLVLRAIPNFGMVTLGVGLLMIAGEFDAPGCRHYNRSSAGPAATEIDAGQ